MDGCKFIYGAAAIREGKTAYPPHHCLFAGGAPTPEFCRSALPWASLSTTFVKNSAGRKARLYQPGLGAPPNERGASACCTGLRERHTPSYDRSGHLGASLTCEKPPGMHLWRMPQPGLGAPQATETVARPFPPLPGNTPCTRSIFRRTRCVPFGTQPRRPTQSVSPPAFLKLSATHSILQRLSLRRRAEGSARRGSGLPASVCGILLVRMIFPPTHLRRTTQEPLPGSRKPRIGAQSYTPKTFGGAPPGLFPQTC